MDPEIHSAEREAAAQAMNDDPETESAQGQPEVNAEAIQNDEGAELSEEEKQVTGWYADLQKAGKARERESFVEGGEDMNKNQEFGREQALANEDAIVNQFRDKFHDKTVQELAGFMEDISYLPPSGVESEVAGQQQQYTHELGILQHSIDVINMHMEDPRSAFDTNSPDHMDYLVKQFRILEDLLRRKAKALERQSALNKAYEVYKNEQVVQQKEAEQQARLTEAAQKAGVEVPADVDKNGQKVENSATVEKELPNEDPYVLNEKDLHNLDRYYTERFRKHIDDSPSQLKYHLDAQLSILNRELSDTRTSAESYQRSVDIHTRAIESGDSHAKAYSREAIEDAKEHLAELTLQARYLEAAIPWLQNKINETKQKNAEYWRQQSNELRQTPGSQAKAEQAEANAHFWESIGAGA